MHWDLHVLVGWSSIRSRWCPHLCKCGAKISILIHLDTLELNVIWIWVRTFDWIHFFLPLKLRRQHFPSDWLLNLNLNEQHEFNLFSRLLWILLTKRRKKVIKVSLVTKFRRFSTISRNVPDWECYRECWADFVPWRHFWQTDFVSLVAEL